jgi:hypothetical protein
MQRVGVPHVDMGGIGTQTVFGANQLKMGVILTQLDDPPFGYMALAVVFLGAIVLHKGCGHQGNHCAPIGVNEHGTHPLRGIGKSAMAVVPLSTRRTMHLLGGKIARAIEGYKGVALDQPHLLKGFPTLQSAQDVCEQRTEAGGLTGGEYRAHRGITGHPLDAVDPWHIALRSLLVQGQQGGRVEREEGKGGHESIRQCHGGLARAMIGKSSQAGS